MTNIVDTLMARKAELESELKQVIAALGCFAPKTPATATPATQSRWSPEARAKLSASLKKAYAIRRAAMQAKTGKY
jgi:hypothetical protein